MLLAGCASNRSMGLPRAHLTVVELPLDQERLDAVLCQRVCGASTAGATADDGDAKGAIESGAIADGLHLS